MCLRELFNEKMTFDFYGACVLFREIPPKNLTENFNEFCSQWTLKWFRILLIFRDASSIALMYPQKKIYKSFRILTYIYVYRLRCFGANGCLSMTKKIEFDRNYWHKHSLRRKTRGLAKEKKEKMHKCDDAKSRLWIEIDWHCDQG